MNRNTHNITSTGKQKLEKELAELEGPKREEIIVRLRHAIEMGDLSENADYTAAKEEQAFIEGRIQEIKAILGNAQIIKEVVNADRIVLGSSFIITIDGEIEETYQLVGAAEANPREGRISDRSPIGKALIGSRVGDTVEVKSPGGNMTVRVRELL